jgi:RecA-family ATPase
MQPLEFVLDVWKHSVQDGDYVFLSTKYKRKKWKEHPFKVEIGLRRRLKEFFQKHSDSDYDIYFCPTPFSKPQRLKDYVPRVNLLWSDIDEGKSKIKPTILWESSPGRLQALWFLNSELTPERAEKLNQALTYYNGADKGGWDLTQVLRVPGTRNNKYESKPRVRIIQEDRELSYNHRRIAKRIGFTGKGKVEPNESEAPDSGLVFERVLSKYRRKITPKVKQLLLQKHVSPGKRSEMLWYIEHKLNEAGLSIPEIICLIRHSSWNKFRGRRDEDKRLIAEVNKIIESNADVPDEEEAEESADEEIASDLVVESYSDVMCAPDANPGWLVRGWWMKESHGAVAGEPKSFKSTLAMDFGISVASGKPFLNRFPVDNPGPVLYIQNENARWIMKDRMAKITTNKGLIGKVIKKSDTTFDITWGPDIPLHMINQQSFLLTDPIHQKQLEDIIKEMKPALVIFDPLYLMFDGDINSAKELAPVLTWLLEIKNRYHCGVMLIHHWKKSSEKDSKRGGQRMLGSTTIHGWIESAWYITADSAAEADEDLTEDEENLNEEEVNKSSAHARVTVEREFRGAGLHPRIDVDLTMGEMGSFEYSATVGLHRPAKKKQKGLTPDEIEREIEKVLKTRKDGMPEKELARAAGLTPEETRAAVDRLSERGTLKRKGSKVVKAGKH